MGREHRIQAALAPVFPYVAAMVGYCDDPSVIVASRRNALRRAMPARLGSPSPGSSSPLETAWTTNPFGRGRTKPLLNPPPS